MNHVQESVTKWARDKVQDISGTSFIKLKVFCITDNKCQSLRNCGSGAPRLFYVKCEVILNMCEYKYICNSYSTQGVSGIMWWIRISYHFKVSWAVTWVKPGLAISMKYTRVVQTIMWESHLKCILSNWI